MLGSLHAEDNLKRENLVAWCIVPFDASKRGPSERAQMLEELGIRRSAYDWRKEHVSEFETEIQEYEKRGIEFFAFWDEHEDAFRLFEQYDIRPQIWKSPRGGDLDSVVESLLPLATRTAELGCRLGVYNHGGWAGEPENLVAVCERLHELGHTHAGIVYNWHHGHHRVKTWAADLELMMPHLLCLNLNGMNPDADPKILPIGEGAHEAEMIRVLRESGYDGPIGILDHRNDTDAREALEANLRGLAEEIAPAN